ncbi:hypothetical protein Smp_034580 [Schistosoma mansoni]|uniref:hypothetical protein n=1 Tax=Schistosoma mansoni TaxID=6183 RepID=UPI0001A641CD|nr:hypothetical protein Smp_034580 [Schistosoma mansoni]|eukprot:XP_018648092.1 hypothetical protein Smp_034580 [Schistosoma mansoni]
MVEYRLHNLYITREWDLAVRKTSYSYEGLLTKSESLNLKTNPVIQLIQQTVAEHKAKFSGY